jgi:hypothetical protein
MYGENRHLVINEPVEIGKQPIEMKNFKLISDLFSIKFSISSKNLRNNQMISLNSRLIMEK